MRLCAFRRERLLLVLVACTAFAFAYGFGWPDISRLALTQSVAVDGSVRIDRWQAKTEDKALYGGHAYSDKAPGMSVLAVPVTEATRTPAPSRWTFEGDPHLWAVRVLVSGLAFLLAAFLVGRVAEGLAPGAGDGALVGFALCTIAGPLAATTFGHVTAAALAFGAFVLAWRSRSARERRWPALAAGAVAGVGVGTGAAPGLMSGLRRTRSGRGIESPANWK
jgi:hypothetical protein